MDIYVIYLDRNISTGIKLNEINSMFYVKLLSNVGFTQENPSPSLIYNNIKKIFVMQLQMIHILRLLSFGVVSQN